jgi:hypothetical protein
VIKPQGEKMFNKNFDRVDTRKRSGRFQKILHRSAGLQGGGGNAVRAGSQLDPIGVSGGETRIVLVTWFPQMQPGSLQGLVLITNDIPKKHAELKKRRVVISEITKKPYGQEASFSDPDGNGWVLQQPAA